MHRALVGFVVAACAALGLAGSTVPATATASAPATGGPAGGATDPAGGSAELWTDARMRHAREADDLGALRRLDTAPAPAVARLAAPAPVRSAATWTTGGRVAGAVGRVFFTLGGRDFSCTGVAVPSANRSTVLTAGHCVHDGPGRYATHWVFVPGYADGRRPYGTWPARALGVPPGWARSGRMQDDVGVAVVAPVRGRRLTDAVGSVPVGFNRPRGAYVWAFGYPAAAPNGGRRVQFCRGRVEQDPWATGAQGLACSMGQGASGGPWLAGFSTTRKTGELYAVTSFTYRGVPGKVWAPYLGAAAKTLYDRMQRR